MIVKAVTVCVLVFVISVNSFYFNYCYECNAYRWCDYKENISSKAIEGGVDADGNSFYIGEVCVLPMHSWTPCMLYPSSQTVRIPYLDTTLKIGPDTHVHVLCSSYNQTSFKWVNATSDGLYMIWNQHSPVIADNPFFGEDLYIGRVQHDGKVAVGAVYPKSRAHKFHGFLVNDGKELHQYNDFEVLIVDQ